MFENHKDKFDAILKKMSERVPGVKDVQAEETVDGRIVLRFQDGKFKDPFAARYVSDGTIKMFTYLMLLSDPKPHALLCIEEPENQLYPLLLSELAEEFRQYSNNGAQVFISTHSPDFLNAVAIEELYCLIKKDGYTKIYRARENELVTSLFEGGDLLGYLWNQGLLTEGFGNENSISR
jgi:predicted ATPase